MKIAFSLMVLLTFFSLGCSVKKTNSKQRMLSESGVQEIEFKNSQADISVLQLARNDKCSVHKIRLKGAEEPHMHVRHDLMVYVLRGKGRVHFKDRVETLQVGDFVSIPKGVFHWAENIGKTDAEVLVVFTPPFDGKDKALVK